MGFTLSRLAGATAVALSLAMISPALAQPGAWQPGTWNTGGDSGLSLPQPGVAPSGFTLDLFAENMHRFGDMPLHVRVSPTGPTFLEDRELTLRVAFIPITVDTPSRATSYQFTLRIPANAGPVEQSVYLPKWFLGGRLTAVVLEQGQVLPGYQGQMGAAVRGHIDLMQDAWLESAQNNFGWIAGPQAVPLARASGAQVDDLRVLLAALAPELLAIEPMTDPATAANVLRQYGTAAGLHYRTVGEVPEDWQGLNQCHVWITRWSTYQWLIEHRPAAELALRRFVRCGGALWLLDAGDEQAVAAQLQTAWGSQWFAQRATEATAQGRVPYSGYTLPADSGRQEDVVAYLQRSFAFRSSLVPRRQLVNQAYHGYGNGISDQTTLAQNTGWLTGLASGAQRDETFTIRLGLGLIVGCRSEQSVPGTYQQWRRMIGQSQEHTSSVLTRGVDPIAGSNRFWNWVIPGVAQPPVYTFMALLALFVVLVGPVAYRKLTRMGRGYLMFVVAPVLAMVTTLFLFGYGLVADGLGTQARVRQITWVCDRDGGAMRYWRSTYFAGVRPSDGLRFPAETRLEPFYLNEFRTWVSMVDREATLLGHITLGDDFLKLGNGFLPSRQQRQFVAYRPLERAGRLIWLGRQDNALPAVRNEFAYPLRELVVRTLGGDYWSLAEVAPGATAPLVALDEDEASRKLSELYVRHRLEPPPGVDVSRRSFGQMDLIRDLVGTEGWRDTAAGQRAASSDGVIEGWLQHTLQINSALREGTFIALSDVTEDCVAVESAKLVESVHYVIGELR